MCLFEIVRILKYNLYCIRESGSAWWSFYAIITVSIRTLVLDQTRDDDEFDSTWIGTLVGTISSDSDLSTDNSVR